ncbi:IS3 family transposase [Deferribacter autotrophicus]|uniref:IS3 family transposase n=1 Tax=Deferribacter autotrophicus TaxID=500465 RepID=UPI001FED6F3C|nr:IS3 family transposase [Deferribacter autotrophicus]
MRDNMRNYSVERMCRLLGVSRSGYYKWRCQGLSKRRIYRQKLLSKIREIYGDSRGLYGSPRIHAELIRIGYKCSRKLVSDIMRKAGIRSRIRKSYKRTTIRNYKDKYSENLLKKNDVIHGSDSVWVSDITYLKVSGGWKYLTTIMDLYSRKIVGYAFSTGMSARETVLRAFRFAVKHCGRIPSIFHSDRGSQYSSLEFRNELKRLKISQSMTSDGHCYDNAYAESFFKTVKVELVQFLKGMTWEMMKNAIFEYIECFYNRKRLHSGIGYLTPDEKYQSFCKLNEMIA